MESHMNILPILNPAGTVTADGHHVIISSSPTFPFYRDNGGPIKPGDYHVDTYHYDKGITSPILWKCGPVDWEQITREGTLDINLSRTEYDNLTTLLRILNPELHAVLTSRPWRPRP